MSDLLILSDKSTTEIVDYGGKFVNVIPDGAVISAAELSAITLTSGTDATPGDLIAGAATFSGTIVTQRVIAGGADGNEYCLVFKVTLDDGQKLEIHAQFTLNDNC